MLSGNKILENIMSAVKGGTSGVKSAIEEAFSSGISIERLSPAVYECINLDNIAALKVFLENGYPPDFHQAGEKTGLMHAVSLGKLNIAKVLVDFGANVSLRDGNSRGAIFYAANEDCLRFLIERGAVIDSRDNQGRTPLVYNVMRIKLEPAICLIKLDCNIVCTDTFNKNVFDYMNLIEKVNKDLSNFEKVKELLELKLRLIKK